MAGAGCGEPVFLVLHGLPGYCASRVAGEPSTRETRRLGATGEGFARSLALIALLGLAIRVVYTLTIAPWPPPGFTDEFFYHSVPDLVARGQGFILPGDFLLQHRSVPTARHPPLYPVLLAGLAKLGGTGQEVQRLTGCVFGTVTVATLGVLGRRLMGARAGLIAAGIAALYPVLITADGALMSESLYGMLVALSLLAAYRLFEAVTVGRAIVLGALLGLAALTRGEALLLVPLLLTPLLLRPKGPQNVAIACLAVIVVLMPWTVRNWIVFDQPVLVATAGESVAGANCDVVYYGPKIGSWDTACLTARPKLNEAEASDKALRVGVRYALDHSGRVPLVATVRILRAWGFYEPWQAPEGRSGRVMRLGALAYFVLVPLAVAGFVLLRRRRRPVWILITPLILVLITVLLTYGNVRFRHPAELSLVLFAAASIDWAIGRVRDRRSGPAPAETRPAMSTESGAH